jgi:hypothetical protein
MGIDLITTTPQSVELDRYPFLNELKRITRLADSWMITGLMLAEHAHLLLMAEDFFMDK